MSTNTKTSPKKYIQGMMVPDLDTINNRPDTFDDYGDEIFGNLQKQK